jgi:hypothetical protein
LLVFIDEEKHCYFFSLTFFDKKFNSKKITGKISPVIFRKPSHSKWKILHFAQKSLVFSQSNEGVFVQIANKKPLAEARGFYLYF